MHRRGSVSPCYFRCLFSTLIVAVVGCARSMPPEVSEPRTPAKIAVRERVEPALAADTVEAAPAAAPAPPEAKPEPPKPAEAPKPAPVVPKAEAPPPPPIEEARAPTIVGSWRVSEMTRNGEPMPGLDQMDMTFTFGEDNTVTMTMSSPQMPEPQTRSGTYSYADGQITISLDNDTKTGPCTFEGNNKVTLEIEGMKLVLTRT